MKKKTKDSILLLAAVAAILGFVYEFALKPLYDSHRASISREISSVVETKLEGTTSKVTSIDARLIKIENNLSFLDPLIHQAVQNQFKKLSTLTQEELQRNLQILSDTVNAARIRNIATDPNLLTAISLKLSKLDKEQGFWPTTASFLTYRSENSNPQLAKKFGASPEAIPRCTDKEPTPYKVSSILRPNKIAVHLENYRDCRIQLDDPQDMDRINYYLLHGFSGGLGCVHCLVVYRGGDIPLLLLKNARPDLPPLGSLGFEDCVYDFSVSGTPSAQGQQTLLVLLLNRKGELYMPPGGGQIFYSPPK